MVFALLNLFNLDCALFDLFFFGRNFCFRLNHAFCTNQPNKQRSNSTQPHISLWIDRNNTLATVSFSNVHPSPVLFDVPPSSNSFSPCFTSTEPGRCECSSSSHSASPSVEVPESDSDSESETLHIHRLTVWCWIVTASVRIMSSDTWSVMNGQIRCRHRGHYRYRRTPQISSHSIHSRYSPV